MPFSARLKPCPDEREIRLRFDSAQGKSRALTNAMFHCA